MAGTTSGVNIVQNGADVDITLYQGKTVNFNVIWGGSSPINVTGYSARMQVRECVASTTAIISLTNGSGITVGTTDGKFTFSISATTTAAYSAMNGVYDFEIVDGSGNVYLVMSGLFIITPEVTR